MCPTHPTCSGLSVIAKMPVWCGSRGVTIGHLYSPTRSNTTPPSSQTLGRLPQILSQLQPQHSRLVFNGCNSFSHNNITLPGVHVPLGKLHLQGDCSEQSWGQLALRSFQGVPHPGGRALPEPRERHRTRNGSKQPCHLLDGQCSSLFIFVSS